LHPVWLSFNESLSFSKSLVFTDWEGKTDGKKKKALSM
jgi:hypothetical protein